MDTDEDEHPIMEFELPIHGGPSVLLFQHHSLLFADLGLNEDDKLLLRLFYMMAALCDPMTQPGESKDYQLSVKGLADAATGLGYQILLEMRHEAQNSEDGDIPSQLAPTKNVDLLDLKFTLSLKFFEILQAINVLLRAEDELRLRHLDNRQIFWQVTEHYWLPNFDIMEDDQPLKVLYYMCCTIIMSIYLMFKNTSMGISPYNDYFLRLWKSHSSIVQLALEVDRELEEEGWDKEGQYFDTPEIVKRVLMGSSAVRIVLAAVLEDFFASNPSDNLRTTYQMTLHDMETLSMLDFFDPLSREMVGGGSIHNEVYNLAVAMLILRLYTNFSPCQPIEPELLLGLVLEVVDYPSVSVSLRNRESVVRSDPAGLSYDLIEETYYDDKLDDDVKYVFGHYESEEESGSEAGQETEFPMALRKDKDDIEFDEQGRDWRDQVRGSNVNLTPQFKALLDEFISSPSKEGSDHFFSSFEEIEEGLKVFTLLEIEYMPKFLQHVGQSLLNTVAYAATRASEGDHELIDRIHVFLVSPAKSDLLEEALQQKPYLIQRRHVTAIELIFVFNPKTACALMDELLMVNGLRRLIIWFLCHSVNLHMSLINHVYELVAGYRGNSPKGTSPYRFSRQGALELSPVEKLMLLHEFLINSGAWLVSGIGEVEEDHRDVPAERAEKIVSCLCLMILKLIDEKIIVLLQDYQDEFEDYSQDIRVLLFPWIGRVQEARRLYFEVTKANDRENKELSAEQLHGEQNYEQIYEQKYKTMEEGLKRLGVLDNPDVARLFRQLRPNAESGVVENAGAINKFLDTMGKETLGKSSKTPASKVLEALQRLDTRTNAFVNGFETTTPEVLQDMIHSDILTEEKRDEDAKEVETVRELAENGSGQLSTHDRSWETTLFGIAAAAYGVELPVLVPSVYVFELFRDYLQLYPTEIMDTANVEKIFDLLILRNFEKLLRLILGENYKPVDKALQERYMLEDKAPEGAPESEFNDEFLNGEGQFQEKQDKKKKKKKKAKKKKK